MFSCSEYNEKLVMRGKILTKIVFLKEIDNELRRDEQRKERVRRGYGDSPFTFFWDLCIHSFAITECWGSPVENSKN